MASRAILRMKLTDFNRLKKIMELASSPVDGEALNAIRKANELLVREGLTWTRVLDRSIQIISTFETSAEGDGVDLDEADDIDSQLERALNNASGDFRNVILSFEEQWTEKHYLSPRQREVLERTAQNRRR